MAERAKSVNHTGDKIINPKVIGTTTIRFFFCVANRQSGTPQTGHTSNNTRANTGYSGGDPPLGPDLAHR